MSGGEALSSAEGLERSDFIRDRIRPLAGNGASAAPVELTRHRHGIVEYRFEGGARLFAKPVDDAVEARGTYVIQRTMWEEGFGEGSPFRVPEPLAYLADERVLVIGAAQGECLRELQDGDPSAWIAGLRRAAQWLAALHAAPLRLGPADDPTSQALHLARRAVEAAARRPALESRLRRALTELSERSAPAGGVRAVVQTHGRYHAQHVYLSPECVTVIDVDRASRGDPAKDVGEFLHRLRMHAHRRKLDPDVVGSGEAAFLEEYGQASGRHLPGLAYYWSYSLLFTLCAWGGRAGVTDEQAEEQIDFCETELAALPDRLSAYGLLS